MTKFFCAISKGIKHNIGLSLMACVAIAILCSALCCESRTPSILNPAVKITRSQLEAELTQIESLANEKSVSLERQDAIKKIIADQAVILAQGGTLNPAGIVTTLLSILGIGSIIDNKRKDYVITKLKTNNPVTP
jgi:hypothetical protein